MNSWGREYCRRVFATASHPGPVLAYLPHLELAPANRFGVVAGLLPIAYATQFLNAGEEFDLLQEGLMPAFGMFLVRAWCGGPRPA